MHDMRKKRPSYCVNTIYQQFTNWSSFSHVIQAYIHSEAIPKKITLFCNVLKKCECMFHFKTISHSNEVFQTPLNLPRNQQTFYYILDS